MNKDTAFAALMKRVRRDKYLLLMLLPSVLFFVIFAYVPMAGLAMAFQDFKMGAGFFGSPWVGLRWFREFFGSVYFGRVLSNTLILSLLNLVFTFPIPIVFALLLNEVRCDPYKRIVQTVSYLPHFISVVIVVGLMVNIFSPNDGIINKFVEAAGGSRVNFMARPEWFRPLYIGSGVWQEFGWNSIIYLAALSGIDPTLYEAATIDGAGRWKQVWHVTLPGILPTIIMLLILSIGSILNVGFEKIILMYSPSTYETADVISTYVYRKGIAGAEFGYGVAVGLFNSVLSFALLWVANTFSKKATEVSMW